MDILSIQAEDSFCNEILCEYLRRYERSANSMSGYDIRAPATDISIEPTANGNNWRHCPASCLQKSALPRALNETPGKSIGGDPISNRPTAQAAAMIGPIVHGLLMHDPVKIAGLLNFQMKATIAASNV